MTLTTRTALSTLLLAALTAGTARAVPAYPDSISVLQPDGTRVSLCLRGDEYLHWAVSPDGFTLLQDEAGFWTFATHDNDGRLAPSSLRYSNSSEPARLQGPDSPSARSNWPRSTSVLRCRRCGSRPTAALCHSVLPTKACNWRNRSPQRENTSCSYCW